MKTFCAVVLVVAVVMFSVSPAIGLEEAETQDLLAAHGLKILRTFTGQEVVAPVEVPGWTDFVGPLGAVLINGGNVIAIGFYMSEDPTFLYTEFYDSKFRLRAIVWGPPSGTRVAIDLELGGKLSGVLAIAAPEPDPEPEPKEPGISAELIHWSI